VDFGSGCAHKCYFPRSIIKTLLMTHFIQGIGMQCDKCNGPGWQTYEKTYVKTLPKRQQQQLNAIIVGASNGIDMDLLVQMRNSVSAAALEKTSRSNLIRRHNALADDYKNWCASTGVCDAYYSNDSSGTGY
jgi:hypothetical protein